jgi:hypothetical protein
MQPPNELLTARLKARSIDAMSEKDLEKLRTGGAFVQCTALSKPMWLERSNLSRKILVDILRYHHFITLIKPEEVRDGLKG